MTTETALTLPERASVALGSKDYRAAAEKTCTIRRFIDEHLDLMTDEQLSGVLQFVAELMNEPQQEAA